MEIIKIDKSSIRKNPDAGSSSTSILMGRDVTFEYEGREQLPENFHITSWEVVNEGTLKCSGIVLGEFTHEDCRIKGLKISEKLNHSTINHIPIPEYSYDYENTEVTCEECNMEIKVRDIIEDIIEDYDYNFTNYQVCPNCYAINSFNYAYQKIEECL